MYFIRCLIVLVMLLQGCGSEEHIQKYLDSGKALFKAGDYAKAKVEFKNALQIDNKSVEAYYYIAQIDEKNQNWQGMFANLMGAIKLDPKHFDARIKLSRLYLFVGEYDKAFEQVDIVLVQAPENVDALVQKGTILLRQGKLKESMDFADKALAKQADHVDATVLKSAVYMKNKDSQMAINTVDKLLKTRPDDMSLYSLKLEIYRQNDETAKVEQTFLELIKRFPQNNEFVIGLASHYEKHGDDDKAIIELRNAVERQPANIKPKMALIDFLLEKKPDLFEKQAKEFLLTNPDESDIYFRLANYYIKEKRIDEAKQALNWIIDHKGDSKQALTAKVVLATIEVQNNDIPLATSLVNEVLAIDERHFEGMMLKANLDLINGAFDEAISQLRTIVRDYPKSDEAMVLLARAYTSKNSPELASENFRKALELNPGNFDAVLPVVSGMLKNQDLSRAEEVLQQALEKDPGHPGALQAMAQIRLLKKDWAGSQKVADTISTKPKGLGFSKYLSGKISEGQGLYKEAAENYMQALEYSPELEDALTGVVKSLEALKQNSKTHDYLDKYIAAHPEKWFAVVLKGQVLTVEQRWAEAIKLLDAATARWPKEPEIYESLANVYLGKNDLDSTISTYVKGLQANPEDTRIKFMLASAYEQQKKYAQALEKYEALVAKNPNMDFAVNNYVSLLLDRFESPENIDKAFKLAAKFEKSGQPYFLDTYGWALYKTGKIEDALTVFKNVVALSPDVAVFHYHLGVAHMKLNDSFAAAADFEKAIAIGKTSGDFAEEDEAVKLLASLKADKKAK